MRSEPSRRGLYPCKNNQREFIRPSRPWEHTDRLPDTGQGKMRSYLMSTESQFGKMKKSFGDGWWQWVHNNVKVLK